MRKTKRTKVLALLGTDRLDTAKDNPTITESKSLKDFTSTIWTGYVARRDAPEAKEAVLHKAGR